MEAHYGVKEGQIYAAANGSNHTLLVIDASTYIECDDVVVQPFYKDGRQEEPRRIDTFKLAMVRYNLVDTAPDWMLPMLPSHQAPAL